MASRAKSARRQAGDNGGVSRGYVSSGVSQYTRGVASGPQDQHDPKRFRADVKTRKGREPAEIIRDVLHQIENLTARLPSATSDQRQKWLKSIEIKTAFVAKLRDELQGAAS